MRIPLIGALLLAAISQVGTAAAGDKPAPAKPTIVLVHGAFAESSSWDPVVARLNKDGYRVIAAANPLRGVTNDAAAVARIVKSIGGPVVLVGHSYGGPVITEAAAGNANVIALVYVSAFAPDVGESSQALSAKFPGSTLGANLITVALPDGDEDLYIRADKFRDQFAADVPAAKAALMAASQRPITLSALGAPSRTASWKTLPSYMIYGTADRNIPAAVMKFMAERAGARDTVAITGASHALMISHSSEVAAMIEEAAGAK
ncbi:alpha/beta fold hydrolase [Sphingomonas pruni]|uniref:alpha/beta fold hydrolase n=1 Tax=Sphingomonas pruni TaxID=40683 RepID=UPI000830A6A1|nr:alpha/beta hydrolase [Sphingomonas pruni]